MTDQIWLMDPEQFSKEKFRRALVVGCSGGIGSTLYNRLTSMGWDVLGTTSKELDLTVPERIDAWVHDEVEHGQGKFDLVVFAAGRLDPIEWTYKRGGDFTNSYLLHAVGPLLLLNRLEAEGLLPWWATAVLISSVGAVNAGAVDLAYGMAKAAMEKMHRALSERVSYRLVMVRLDLVNTRMLHQLPMDTLHGRRVMEKEEAVDLILGEAGVV